MAGSYNTWQQLALRRELLDGLILISDQKLVLIVDDQPLVRETVQQLFEALGHHSIVAANGAEAMDLIEERFDLVLLDATLPDTTAAQLLARLRSHYRGPVVFMSGFNREDVVEALGEDYQGFLSKPFGMEELAEIVQKLT